MKPFFYNRLTLGLLTALSFQAMATEGFFYPKSNLENAELIRKASLSVVNFEIGGSGVVISSNTILTARHVVKSCKCGEKCELDIKSPLTLNPEGIVTSWATGKTKVLLRCGVNSDIKFSELFEKTFSRLPSGSLFFAGTAHTPFAAKLDIALLSTFWNDQTPPPATLAISNPIISSKVFQLGFPSRSKRDRSLKILRHDLLADVTKAQTQYLITVTSAPDFRNELNQIQEKAFANSLTVAQKYMNSALEKEIALVAPLEGYLLTSIVSEYLTNGAAKRVCQVWNPSASFELVESCEKESVVTLLKEIQTMYEGAVRDTQHETLNHYPNAVGDLRVSFGSIQYYGHAPTLGKLGIIETDIDGTEGNSGGPHFDSNGKLIGIATWTSMGSHLTRRFAESKDPRLAGTSGLSLEGIREFLQDTN